jgi:hypothetical protein
VYTLQRHAFESFSAEMKKLDPEKETERDIEKCTQTDKRTNRMTKAAFRQRPIKD